MAKSKSLAQIAVKDVNKPITDPLMKKLIKQGKDPHLDAVPDEHHVYWKDVKTQFPEIAESLKTLFGGREKLKVADVKALIKSFEPDDSKFWISFDSWDRAQRDLGVTQKVVQLNIGPELQKLIADDPVLHEFFERFFTAMHDNGHPSHSQTIAWSRVYDFGDEYVVEELQSDIFGASTKLRETANSSIDQMLEAFSPEQRKHLEDFWTKHFSDWDKKLLATILQMARKTGAKRVWIFDEQYKAKYLQTKSKLERYYKTVPRDLGFKRAVYVKDNLKIPSWVRVVASFSAQVVAKYEVAK